MIQLLLLAAIALTVSSNPVDNCEWGPSYWCQSKDIASTCGKTAYCRQEVWKNNIKVSDPKLSIPSVANVGDGNCDLCKTFANIALNYIESNSTQQEFEDALESLCGYLGDLKDECDNLVEQYVPQIWDLVKADVTPDEVCQRLGLCTNSSVAAIKRLSAIKLVTPKLSPLNSVTCKICNFLSEVIVLTFKKDSSKDHAKSTLLNACKIPKPVQTECTNFVNKNFNKLWDKLQDKTDSPQIVCSELFDFCPAKLLRQARGIVNGLECKACKDVVSYAIKKEEKKFNVNDSIDKLADDVCEIALNTSGSDASGCEAILKDVMYHLYPDVERIIKELMTPEKICELAGICDKSSILTAVQALYAAPLPTTSKKVATTQVKGGIECDICKLIINFMKPYIESNSTEQEAKAAVEQACDLLPSSYSSECKTLVNDSFDTIWDLVKQDLDSGAICAQIGLCSSAKQETKQVKGGVECDLCKLAVNFMRPYIDSNSTEQEAKAAIEQLCKILPSSVSSECTTLVDDSFDMIWKLVENDVDTGAICTQLGLCSSAKQETKQVKGGVECDLCKLAVNFMRPYINSNSTEQEAKAAIEQLCKILPSSVSSECTTLVDDSFDMIWKLVENDVDTGAICTQLGLCSSAKTMKVKTVQKTKQPTLKQGSSIECTVCKLAIPILKSFVDSSSTEAEIKNAVEGVCKVLPSEVQNVCTTVVDEYFDKLWKLVVENELDNNAICSQLGLCSSAKVVKPVSKADPQTTTCDFCKLFVQTMKMFLNSDTEDVVKEGVEKLCSLLPSSLSSECTSLVDSSFDIIWNMVVKGVDDGEICVTLGFCAKTLKVKPVQVNDRNCDLCKLAVSFLKPYVDSNATENEVKQAVEKLCQMLPPNYTTECNALVDTYFDVVWALVKSEFDNDNICTTLGLCSSTATLKTVKPTPRVKQVKQNTCDLCELFVTLLKPYADSNATKQEVNQTLQQLCNILPDQYKSECRGLISSNFEVIWALVESEFDNDLICKQLGLCNSTTTLKMIKHAPQTKQVKDSTCDMCKLAVSFLKHYVDSNTTEQEVKAALNQLCGIMPPQYKDQCTSFVKDQFEAIWTLLKAEVDSGTICQQINLCNSTSLAIKPITVQVQQPQVKQTPCDLCKLAVNYIKPYMDSNATEQEIKAALNQLCEILPSVYQDQCTSFVKDNFGTIWTLLKVEVDTGIICQQAGLCNSTSLTIKPKQPQNIITCTVCGWVVKELEGLINTSDTVNNTLALLDKVCDLVPSSLKDECKDFINTYGKEIINEFINGESPKLICSVVGLCAVSQSAIVTTPKLGDTCEDCTDVLTVVKTFMTNDPSLFQSVFDDLCELMPQSIKAECESIVNTYTKEIIDLIANAIDPQSLCKDIKLCQSLKKFNLAKIPRKSLSHSAPPKKSLADVECVACEQVFETLEAVIPKEKDNIVSGLNSVCGIIPSDIGQVCKLLVTEFGDQFLNDIANAINPRVDCKAVGVCKSTRSPSLANPLRNLKVATFNKNQL